MNALQEISGIRFVGDAALLKQRSFITGVRRVTESEVARFNYEQEAWVPKSPLTWRRPTITQLRPFMATDSTHQGITVEVIKVAPSVVATAYDLYHDPDFQKDTEDFSTEILPGVFGNLNDIISADADMPTTITRDPAREHPSGGVASLRMGVHLDNKQQVALIDRPDAQRRAIIHGGGDDRYGAFIVTANAIDVGLESHPTDASFVPNTQVARSFLERNPTQQVVLVEFGEGEALIIPHQVGMHDGVTRGKGRSNLIVVNEDLTRRWQPDTFRSASVLQPRDVVYLTDTIRVGPPGAGREAAIESTLLKKEEVPGLPFGDFILAVDQRCNLRCTYCCVYNGADKSFATKPEKMSDEVIAQSALRISEHARSNNLSDVTVTLHGGEPTLRAVDDPTFLRRAVTTICEAMPLSTNVHFVIQSNATLFAKHPEIVRELNELGITVGVSLDGDREANKQRVNLAGRESYDEVVKGLQVLQQYPDIYGGILCVVDPTTDAKATYEALCSFNPPMIDFNLSHQTWDQADESQVTKYAEWLLTVYDLWQKDKEMDKKVPEIRFFNSIRDGIYGRGSGVETIGLQVPTGIVIESNGTWEMNQAYKVVYEGAPEIGMNIWDHSADDVLRHPKIAEIQKGEGSLSDICHRCEVYGICGGGMCVHRHSKKEIPEKGIVPGYQNPSSYCTDLKSLIKGIITREYDTTVKRLLNTAANYYVDTLGHEFSESLLMRGLSIAMQCKREGQDPKLLGQLLLKEMHAGSNIMDHSLAIEILNSIPKDPAEKYVGPSYYELYHSFIWAHKLMRLDVEDYDEISRRYSDSTGKPKDPYKTLEHDVSKWIWAKQELEYLDKGYDISDLWYDNFGDPVMMGGQKIG